MAVMNGTGGIDQQITNRITSAGGNPQKLMGQYGNTKSILDLIAAQRAADLVKEQKQQVALAMNSNPATVADQLEKELVDGQKAEMRGPLEGLKNLRGDQAQGDKTRGVAGVLANQQRMAQQQRPTMNVAHGGIINAPAPNLNRMYNGGIVGYKDGGEISREEYIAKVKALIASGVAQEDAMAQMDAEFDISSGTREERRDVSLEDNRLLPKGNRRFIRADEVYKTQAPGTETRNTRNIFMGKSTQGNQPYSVPDPEGDLLAAIAGEKQPEVEPDSTQRQLGTTQMGMGRQPIAGDMNQDLGAMIEVNKGKIEPIRALTEPEVESEVESEVEPEVQPKVQPKVEPKISQADFMKQVQGMPGREAFNQKVADDKEQAQEDAFQAEANKPLSGSAAIQEKLDAMRGKKGLAGLVERFANTSFTPTYGGTGEALAQAGRDIAKTGKDEKAAERKFLEEQLGVQQGIEAEAIKAAEDKRQFGLTLGEKIAAREEAGEQFTQKFDALNSQFDAKLKQDGDYQTAKIAVDEALSEIRRQAEANRTAELSNQTAVQVYSIMQKMNVDYGKMVELEVQNIQNNPSIGDPLERLRKAEEHRRTRNKEFQDLRAGLLGNVTVNSGSGGSGWGDPSVKGT